MAFKRQRVVALVLARRDVGEAGRLLTLFTRERGLLRAEARGVRRIPSRRGGHLEPLTRIVCLIAGSHGRYFISGAENEELFTPLQQQAAARQQAERLAALLLRVLQLEAPYPELYDALNDIFEVGPTLPESKRNLLEVGGTLFVLEQAGFQADFTQCGHCRQRTPEGAAVISGQIGGWHCLTCTKSFAASQHSLSARCLVALRWLAQHPRSAMRLKVTDEESTQLLQAVRQLAEEITQAQKHHVAIR